MKKILFLIIALLALPICYANMQVDEKTFIIDNDVFYSVTYEYGDNAWFEILWGNPTQQVAQFQLVVASIEGYNSWATNKIVNVTLERWFRHSNGYYDFNITESFFDESVAPFDYPKLYFVKLSKGDTASYHIRVTYETTPTSYEIDRGIIGIITNPSSSEYGICSALRTEISNAKYDGLRIIENDKTDIWSYTKSIVGFNLEIWGYIFLIVKILVVLFAIGILLYFIFYIINLIKGEGGGEIRR